MKIEIGKTYITRNGYEVGPMVDSGSDVYPFSGIVEGKTNHMFTASGRYWSHDEIYDLDIVAEVPTAAANAHIVAVTINGKPAPASKPFVHSNREAAVTEAKRLAALSPGSEFAVYQRVSAVTAELVMREAA